MKNKKTTIIISLIFTIILFIMFNKEHFAPDTYVFSTDIPGNANWYLLNGRVVMSLFLRLCVLLNLSAQIIKVVSLILSFISLFASSLLFNKILSRFIHKDLELGLISCGIVYSPFLIEFYLFPEYTGIMCLSILFGIISLYFLINYFDNKKILSLILSTVFCMLCVLSYQELASFFSVISLFVCYCYNSDIKKFIKSNFFIYGIYGFSSFVSLIITKMMKLARLDTAGYDLIESIKNIFHGSKHLAVNTFYIFPKYFFIALLLFSFIIVVFLFIRLNKKSSILFIIYLIAVSIALSLLPQLFVKYDMVWVVPRSNIVIGMIPILLLLIFYSFNQEKDKYKTISIVVIFLTFILQIIGWYQIREDHYYTNVADRTDATEILNNIKKYELDNDANIKNISFAFDKNVKPYYDEVWTSDGDINSRVFISDWGTSAIIDYYSDKPFNYIKPSDELIEYCLDNDWDLIRNNMFRYDGDTLYLCIY